jgi:hypothetical protein
MDGPEGESHPYFGARLMERFFGIHWYGVCLYHSRFLAKQHGVRFSQLCVADKLSFCYTPRWIYLPMVNWSGEIHEYMKLAEKDKYATMKLSTENQLQWYDDVDSYLYNWVQEHKDGSEDTWTPDEKQAASKSGVWK